MKATQSTARFLLAALFLFVIVQAVAWLTGALGVDGNDTSPAETMEIPREATGTHSLAEWPADAGLPSGEAPILRAEVEAGRLPPLRERLPVDPLVIVPPEQEGPYGGAWRRAATGPADISAITHRILFEGLVRWNPAGTEVWPNLAKSWEISDDAREFTFHLRRGIRWSDGEPFTNRDIRFWYEDVLLNRELTPVVSHNFRHAGETVEVEFPDDHTVVFRFAATNGLFMEKMATGGSVIPVAYPKHYLSAFHPNHVGEEEATRRARERNFTFWYQLFEDRYEWRNAEIPRLWPWVMRDPPPAQPVLFARNPYYWKVDPSGNQLPYIDRITLDILNNETINMRAIQGGIGKQMRHLEFTNLPLFLERRERENYRVLYWLNASGGEMVVAPNLNHRDPAMRKLLHDRRFRIALSIGIDRGMLNEAGFFGLGRPRQMAPPRSSPFYCPDYESAYIEYDPAGANRLLDEIGLTERDRRGFRLLPDGRPVRLVVETTEMIGNQQVLQLMVGFWRDLGILADLRYQSRDLFIRRLEAVQHDIAVWTGSDEQFPLMDVRWFFPSNSIGAFQGIAYGRWFETYGEAGEEPPPEIRRCMELFREIELTVEADRRRELFQKIIDLNRENLWMIGLIGELPMLAIADNRMRNVPDAAMSGWIFRTPSNTAPECYAYDPDWTPPARESPAVETAEK